MRRLLLALALTGLAGPAPVRADGLLIPTDRSLPPLALMSQRVTVEIDGQVATTTVEQSYRNSTGRDLEAEYLFPLPPGASVRDFSMWVGGKRYRGEAVEANQARETYEGIVARLQDPGLLEYLGGDLWKMRIYPVPRHGEQKIEIRFTSVLPRDGALIAYRYPLRTGQTTRKTIGDFTMTVRLKSPEPLGPIYSPSHDVAIDRTGRRDAVASFERPGCTLDRDFVLYFAPKGDRLGFSLMARRDSPEERGYFLLLLSPRAEARAEVVPRDLVFVLDTSSSMGEVKMRQAKGALLRALGSLGPADRFGLIQFATLPTPFRSGLRPATASHLADAREWVEGLRAEGSTDIAAALLEALKLRRGGNTGRAFQVVFMTDGLPTVGLTSPSEILDEVRNQAGREARIFTFGVGDDVDSKLLDQLAEATRGSSTYVRPAEDLEVKASRLLAQIQRPVRTDLELSAEGPARLVEMYPPRLPDLFQGEQVQVVGRFEGSGTTRLTLSGRAGERPTSETYAIDFPATASEHDFIAPLWARRKVGYLLDQVRLNGESAEVKDELIQLARDYSIATPYTSLLVVPRPAGTAQRSLPRRRSSSSLPRWFEPGRFARGGGMGGGGMGGMGGMGGGMGGMGGGMGGVPGLDGGSARSRPDPTPAPDEESAVKAERSHGGPVIPSAPAGKEAIDLAQRLSDLKTGGRAEESNAMKTVAGQRFRKVGAAWVDERFKPSGPTLKLRVLGAAYFRLLACHPEVKAVLALGERVTWVSPSGTALIIDKLGQAEVPDAVLDRLFAAPK